MTFSKEFTRRIQLGKGEARGREQPGGAGLRKLRQPEDTAMKKTSQPMQRTRLHSVTHSDLLDHPLCAVPLQGPVTNVKPSFKLTIWSGSHTDHQAKSELGNCPSFRSSPLSAWRRESTAQCRHTWCVLRPWDLIYKGSVCFRSGQKKTGVTVTGGDRLRRSRKAQFELISLLPHRRAD